MAIEKIQKSFSSGKREINYLNKDFQQFKDNLLNFAKTYFPKTFKDYSDASPGLLFIEMAAYVGDVLSFYIDYNLKESFIQYATERKNLIALSKLLGYKPKTITPAFTTVEIFQIVPSKQNINGEFVPDYKYALSIKEGMLISNTINTYRILSPIDFNINTQQDPIEISVFSRDSQDIPTFFLLRKTAAASAGQIFTKTEIINEPVEFLKIDLNSTDVIEILDVYDSDGNRWYETEYLAQDLVITESENVESNDPRFSKFKDTVSYIIKTLRTSRRFVTGIYPNNSTYLEFGSGTNVFDDEVIVPNINTVGKGLNKNSNNISNTSYDPSNFLKMDTYGKAPSNTTLTIRYVAGGGLQSNVSVNELTTIQQVEYVTDENEYSVEDRQIISNIKRSLRVNNIEPGVGGSDGETNDEIRNNALAHFSSQNRAVTKEDYIIRTLAMPKKYGSVAKVHVEQDSYLDTVSKNSSIENSLSNSVTNSSFQEVNNQFAINLYVLSYDNNKKLTITNSAIKHNIREYLNKYRMLTDAINITDGFIINIGVEFEILVYKNYNKKETLSNCILSIDNFFNIDNWSFNQPINISSLELEISKIEGVQGINYIKIKNLTKKDGDEYSENEYNINSATNNKIIYPSLDPSIWEIKFPSRDIIGKAV